MKKFGLSVFCIAIFVLYSIHIREEASESSSVVPTNPLKNKQNLTSTITPPLSSAIQYVNKTAGLYKDGSYTGSVEDAFYGNIQVKAIISAGRITDVQFLQYPNDRSTSVMINQQAMPYLKQEAIQVQSAQVDIVSGATDSSEAFVKSLQSALSQAKSSI